MRIVLLAWLRDWRLHPMQRLLTLLGVTLAIAVVLAVDLANQSAQRAFDRSMLDVAGAATHQILGPVDGFPEAVYVELRQAGWRDLAPVVEGALRRDSGETVYLLGLDPLAEAPFRSAAAGLGAAPVQRLLTEPGTVLVPESVWLREEAAALAAQRAPVLELRTSRGVWTVTPVVAPGAGVGDGLWVTDVATAQILLDRLGRLDRIDVRLDDPDRIAALEARLPDGLDLLPVAARDAAARELAQAFRINLTAMSLLALLVSAFLIYNTLTFSVLRRLEVLDTLHRIGVTRQRIFAVVLVEALLVGVVGTGLGTIAGLGLAQGLVSQVAQTVSDHFFVVDVTSVEPRPLALVAVLLLGIGLSVLAALAPAWEAARGRGAGLAGRAALERRTGRTVDFLLVAGGGMLALGGAIAALGFGGLVGGFVALFLMISGFLLGLPKMLAWSLGPRCAGGSVPRLGSLGRMAARGLEQSLSRSGPAVVALALALAAAIGVSVLVGSFRVSVSEWLGYTLTSDVYVVSATPASARGGGTLPGHWTEVFAGWPEVASVSAAATQEVVSERGLVTLFVLQPHSDWLDWLNLVEGAPDDLARFLREEDGVLITEGFAAHRDLRVGDRIALTVPSGSRSFRIAGVYRDYSHPGGAVLVHADRHGGGVPNTVQSIGLRGAAGVDPAQLEARLQDWLRGQSVPALLTRPADIEAESMAIFDRTFAITHLLRVITLVVAFVAILSALVALQMERAREYAILRSVGLWPSAVRRLVLFQALALGLFAAVAAIPLGLGMGWLLIEVINREAFGWRMDFRFPAWPLVENLLLGLLAAVLASLYPAWRLGVMPIVPALRARA